MGYRSPNCAEARHPRSHHPEGSEIAEMVAGRSVGEGWYSRFIDRHPEPTARRPQSLSRSRNGVEYDDINKLFCTLVKVFIDHKITAAQVFNVDETALKTRGDGKKVIAGCGSRNVWTLDPTASFHLSIVACGSAAGYVGPPAFIFPGQSVKLDILDNCMVPGAAVTTTSTGFMIESLFEEWLSLFSRAVPDDVSRPLL